MTRFAVLWTILLSPALWAQQTSVQEYVIPSGLRLFAVSKKGDANVAAGWLTGYGLANQRSGDTPENRAVVPCHARQSAMEEEDPTLEGLSILEKSQVRQFKEAVAKMSLTEAQAVLQKLELQIESAPAESRRLIRALIKLLRHRIQDEDD
jgi:hypothetical protein